MEDKCIWKEDFNEVNKGERGGREREREKGSLLVEMLEVFEIFIKWLNAIFVGF